MANNCFFEMKIIGKESDVDEFIHRMDDYDAENHFYRIFTCDEYDRSSEGDIVTTHLAGDCAWSLESCCRASGYSEGVDLFEVNTEELNLKMEAWSSEYGVGFQEHYVYDNGRCIYDECIDAEEWWWDLSEYPTYEDYKKMLGDVGYEPPPEAWFDGDEHILTCIIGGHSHYGEWSI